jgi:signal transduction histidine kinase
MFAIICSLITGPWPRGLLKLPLFLRVSLCTLCFVLCMALYLLPLPTHLNGMILVIPMGLASWLLGQPGACTCYFSCMGIQIACNLVAFRGQMWPLLNLIAFVCTFVILFGEGNAIVSLRHMLEAEEQMLQRAEQGKQQMAVAYEQQRRLNQLKNQFILNVNHELRTPLAGVGGYLELLHVVMEQEGHLDRTIHGEYLKHALDNCEELTSIVNNVLETMQIGTNHTPLMLEELPLSRIVHEVIARSANFQRSRHCLCIDIPENLRVWANAQCLRHVLYNLLSNAFKYASPDKAPVIISASLCTEATPQVYISVKDHGPGIPPDQIPLLFDQFVRLPRDLAGTVRGSGLGLYISKHLVEVMGGRIWVESTGVPGQGSRFCFTLPAVAESLITSLSPSTELAIEQQ